MGGSSARFLGFPKCYVTRSDGPQRAICLPYQKRSIIVYTLGDPLDGLILGASGDRPVQIEEVLFPLLMRRPSLAQPLVSVVDLLKYLDQEVAARYAGAQGLRQAGGRRGYVGKKIGIEVDVEAQTDHHIVKRPAPYSEFREDAPKFPVVEVDIIGPLDSRVKAGKALNGCDGTERADHRDALCLARQ